MQGSGFGDIFNIKTFGESHGQALGVIVDGVPAGLLIDEDYINGYMQRRRPGQSKYSTARSESDRARILSGVFEGVTTGTPIMIMVENEDQRSKDYSDIAKVFRPGHADYTYSCKYGIRDYRGGGRSSARETIGRVAAGAIAIKALNELGISFISYTESVGSVKCEEYDLSFARENELHMPDKKAYEKAKLLLDEARSNKDSMGGVATCIIKGVMPGLGEPVFDKLDATISHGIMSLGAVKAIEFGDGTKVSKLYGSQNNDSFRMDGDKIIKTTNHSGGVLGGLSDGSDIVVKTHFKPTPSIASVQETVNEDGKEQDIEIKGRHDPIVVPRALVVIESMCAISVFDALLKNMTSKMDKVISFYGEKS